MTNYDSMAEDIERQNEIGVGRDAWILYLLTQIALASARILDVLEGKSSSTDGVTK